MAENENIIQQVYLTDEGKLYDLYAKNLIDVEPTTDTAPYLFRQSGGDNNAYVGTEETDKLVGASAVVNQLVKNGNFVNTSNWMVINSSLSVANNEATVTVTDTSLASEIRTIVTNRKGHKYFRSAEVKARQGQLLFSWYGGLALTINADGNYQTISDIFESPSNDSDNWRLQLGVRADNSPSEFFAKNIILIDLTAMFGTTIADYVYSLEQATAGSGIAYLRKYGFFTKDYYPYTANTLQSVNTSKHTMVGVNQWDEEWEYGYINLSTGEYTADGIDTWIRSKNKIRIKPNTSLFWACTKSVTTGNFGIIYYDKDGQYISGNAQRVNRVWVTPDNCAYVAFFIPTSWYGKPYTNDVSINYPSTDTEYHAYLKHEYTLPNIDLRGLYKLDASNNLYADGDTLEGDGTLARKYEQRPYQSGDESLTDAITDGTNTVVKLATPTTEQVTGFTNPQIVSKDGTEEYVDNRDMPLPVGHETIYYPTGDKAKLNSLPDATVQNGDFIIRQNNTKMTLHPYESDIDDNVISATKTYSSEKIQSLLLLDGSSIGF